MEDEVRCAYRECDNIIEPHRAISVYLGDLEVLFCSSGCRDVEAAMAGINFSPVRPNKKSQEFLVYRDEGFKRE